MEVEIRQRKRQQEVFRPEWQCHVADLEGDVLSFERVDVGRRKLLQGLARLRHRLLQAGIVERRQLGRRREQSGLHAAQRTERMVRRRQDLEAERQHVLEQPGLDDVVRIDVLFLEVREALAQEAFYATQCLQVVGHAQIVK